MNRTHSASLFLFFFHTFPFNYKLAIKKAAGSNKFNEKNSRRLGLSMHIFTKQKKYIRWFYIFECFFFVCFIEKIIYYTHSIHSYSLGKQNSIQMSNFFCSPEMENKKLIRSRSNNSIACYHYFEHNFTSDNNDSYTYLNSIIWTRSLKLNLALLEMKEDFYQFLRNLICIGNS